MVSIRTIINLLLSILVLLVLLFSAFNTTIVNSNVFVIISFVLNILYAVKNLLWKNKYPYSLYMIFWFSNLFFLSLSPFIQYLFDWTALDNLNVTDEEYLIFNIVIFIYMVIFELVYSVTKVRKNNALLIKINKVNKSRLLINFLILGAILFAHIYFTGFSNMFLRSTRVIQSSIEFSNLGLVLEITLYSAIFILLLNIKHFKNSSRIVRYTNYCFTIIYLLILIFPTSRARFLIGTIYLGLFLSFKNKLSKNSLVLILVISFLVILPFLSRIRFEANIYEIFSNNVFTSTFSYESFIGGEYTTYSMGLAALQYVKNNGLMFGNQMLSNIFFFIPRTIWESKEFSLGYTIAQYYGHHFYNMDSPIPAEFFVDFGIIGIVIFTIFLGMISKKVDYLYWKVAFFEKNNFLYFLYPFIVPMFIFLNRGAFMSAIARMFALIIGFALILFVHTPKLTIGELNQRNSHNLVLDSESRK